MCHVAAEMEREGFTMPLLIGGATTSRVHTAVKITPNYERGQTIYVTDASRAVGVVSSLMSQAERARLHASSVRAEYVKIREAYLKGETKKTRLPLKAARDNRFKIDWSGYTPPAAKLLGTRAFKSYKLAELVPYIDWTPFFQTWELQGKYPRIFEDNVVGGEAKKLFADAQAMLKRLVAEKWLTANAVVGFWPANAVGDDIELYADEARGAPLAMLHTLRQQMARRRQARARQHGAGRFRRAEGERACRLRRRLRRHDGDRRGRRAGPAHRQDRRLRTHHAQGAGRPAGGGLRRAHARAGAPRAVGLRAGRAALGRGADRGELSGHPAGARLSGPARSHGEGRRSSSLLDAEAAAGIQLTESFAMWPGAAVSGLYFSHPDSHYFGVGKVERDQVEDYAARKGWSVEEAERWLGPVLNYDPKLAQSVAA